MGFDRPDGPDGPELDVDFVLHGSAADGTAGPAAVWARNCARGDAVAVLDEGIGFNPAPGREHFLLVAGETGLPAIAGLRLPESLTAVSSGWGSPSRAPSRTAAG
jgi:NADPH-dependent ferric siderophore reductase